jgi:hypothetical protein
MKNQDRLIEEIGKLEPNLIKQLSLIQQLRQQDGYRD